MEENQSKRRKPNKEEMLVAVDRISTLPDPLIHQILLLHQTKYAARTSVLSKRWGFLWETFPVIDLKEQRHQHLTDARERFQECLRSTLSRRELSSLLLLRIQMRRQRNGDLDPLINDLVTRAVTGKVKTLELNFTTHHLIVQEECEQCYVLPEVIFSSGLYLDCLAVEGCKFRVHSSLYNFRSLRILNMKRVHITDHILMNMVERCPSLESLAIKRCKELRTLRFKNSTLNSLCITSCRELEAFSMDVPNLSSFEFDAFHRRDNVDNNIVYREIRGFKGYRVNSFISLTTLFLAHVTMNVETFQVMFSSFPKLEKLTLRFCRIMGRPQITGEKIKFVIFEDCETDVNILAPNIECLKCTMNLRSHRFNPMSGLEFQHLTNLLLQGEIILQDETFRAMVCNCPLLNKLTTRFCTGLKNLKILNNSLESLVVEECRDIENGDINAPALSYFKYVGPILQFSRVIISDQLEVEFYLLGFSHRHRVNYFSQPYHGLRNLLWIFDHSRIITFHCEFVKASTLVEAVWNRLGRVTLDTSTVNTLPPLYYLKHLQMKTTLGDISYIDLLSGLFGLSMCCGCLLIDLESSSITLKFQDPQEAEDVCTPSSQRLIHDCLRDHLLEVEMKNFEGKAEEMEIVQFLLGKSMLLKTMSISFNQKTCEESNADESGYVETTMATICSYFKTSPSIEITFTCFF